MVENKCYKCAELEGCYAGRHGEGNPNCKCFCPCYDKDLCVIVERSENGIRLINRKTMKSLVEGKNLTIEQVLIALNIDFRNVFLKDKKDLKKYLTSRPVSAIIES